MFKMLPYLIYTSELAVLQDAKRVLYLLDQVAPLQCSAFSLLEHAVEINEAGECLDKTFPKWSPAAVRNEGALRNSGAVEEVADTDTTLD